MSHPIHVSLVDKTRRLSFSRAFTLVELLVVIGIIGVLVSILLPSLSRARESANSVKCLSNLRQITQATLMYANDYKGWLPASAAGGGNSMIATNETKGKDWIGHDLMNNTSFSTLLDNSAIAPYVGKPNPALMGPLSNLSTATIKNNASGVPAEVFRCPSDDWQAHRLVGGYQKPYLYSYVMNEMLGTGLIKNSTTVAPAERAVAAYKITQVNNTSEKVMFYEEDSGTIDDGNGQPNFVKDDGSETIDTSFAFQTASYLSGRHSGKRVYESSVNANKVPNPKARGNVGLCDGSARSMGRGEMARRQVLWPKF